MPISSNNLLWKPRPVFTLLVATFLSLPLLLAWSAIVRADDRPATDLPPLARLEVHPQTFKLTGPRQQVQLVVTGYDAAGQVRDVTHAATFTSSAMDIGTTTGSVVLPKADGKATITITAGGQSAEVAIEVTGQAAPEPVSFQYGTLVALSKQGCNSGACHGSPSGKGGFRLSLRAFDAEVDKLTLIREDFGRRTNAVDPERSLIPCINGQSIACSTSASQKSPASS